MSKEKPSSWRVWLTAARPHTLTASISPCLVAYALNHRPDWDLQLAWTIFCGTVQLGTNLHNDYSDFVQGADRDETRVGHARATAKGWWTPEETCRHADRMLLTTFWAGIYVMYRTETLSDGWMWFLVLTSIFNAFAYTGGPYPLGYLGLSWLSIAYLGLGEVFVLLYFGYAATLALAVALRDREVIDWPRQVLWATVVGVLAVKIIIVNNLRDRYTDKHAQKKTTAVRFGRRFGLSLYFACDIVAYSLSLYQAIESENFYLLLPLLTIPLSWKEFYAVSSLEGQALNKHVGGAAKLQFLFCLLLSTALLLSDA